jgi:hypothetical protein
MVVPPYAQRFFSSERVVRKRNSAVTLRKNIMLEKSIMPEAKLLKRELKDIYVQALVSQPTLKILAKNSTISSVSEAIIPKIADMI